MSHGLLKTEAYKQRGKQRRPTSSQMSDAFVLNERLIWDGYDVNDVVARLSSKNIREIVDNKTHVRNVKEAKFKTDSIIASGICPQCGGTLVRRNGKYGKFYGCSNYPKCKFTLNSATLQIK